MKQPSVEGKGLKPGQMVVPYPEEPHYEDAKKYITVPPIRKKEGTPAHPAFYPEWHERMRHIEIQRLKRLARGLMVALVLTSIGLGISLVIIGLTWAHWSPN